MGLCLLTVGIVLYAITAYGNTESPTVGGGIALGLIVACMSLGIVRMAVRHLGFRIGRIPGLAVALMAAVWAAVCAISPEVGYAMVCPVVCAFGMISAFTAGTIRLASSRDGKVSAILVGVGLCIVAIYGLQNLGHYSPDSLYVAKLAQSFGQEPGRVSIIRQYVVHTEYNVSFPYLYPLLMYIADVCTSLGKYAGILVNLIAMSLTGVGFLVFAKKYSGYILPGAVAFLLLTMNKEYLEEVFAIRSIPLALLCSFAAIATVVCQFVHRAESRGYVAMAVAGALAGAATMVRFDEVTLFAFLGVLILWMQKDRRIASMGIYAASALILLLPWMIYSYRVNGSLWITDNAGTMFLVHPAVPNRIDLGDTPSLWNAPGAWTIALLQKSGAILWSFVKCSPCAILCIVASAVALRKTKDEVSVHERRIVIAVSIFYFLKTCMYILVGYKDVRYHIESTVIPALVLMILAIRHREGWKTCRPYRVIRGVVLTGLLACSLWPFVASMIGFIRSPLRQTIHDGTVVPPQIKQMDGELSALGIGNDVGILMLNRGNRYGGHFIGGWTDRKIFVEPVEITVEKLQYLLGKYPDIQYVLLRQEGRPDDGIPEYLDQTFARRPLSEVVLYTVR